MSAPAFTTYSAAFKKYFNARGATQKAGWPIEYS